MGAWGGGPGQPLTPDLYHPVTLHLEERKSLKKKVGEVGNRGNDKMAIFFQFWSPEKVFGSGDQSIYPYYYLFAAMDTWHRRSSTELTGR